MASTALLILVAELVKEKRLRHEFNTDPAGVLTRAGLSDDEKAAFYTMDLQVIGNAVRQQILNIDWMFLKGEFPRTSDLYLPELDESTTEYPSPAPEIFRFSPKKSKVADGKFELNVYGQSFSSDAVIKLVRKAGQPPAPEIVAKGPRVFGTFRCSHARGVMAAGVAGTYIVHIQNAPGLPAPPPPVIGGEFNFT